MIARAGPSQSMSRSLSRYCSWSLPQSQIQKKLHGATGGQLAIVFNRRTLSVESTDSSPTHAINKCIHTQSWTQLDYIESQMSMKDIEDRLHRPETLLAQSTTPKDMSPKDLVCLIIRRGQFEAELLQALTKNMTKREHAQVGVATCLTPFSFVTLL